MPYLSPSTLTQDEQKLILRATAKHARDHVIISLALGTGLRLGELVGLNVGDVYAPDGTPKARAGSAARSPSVDGVATCSYLIGWSQSSPGSGSGRRGAANDSTLLRPSSAPSQGDGCPSDACSSCGGSGRSGRGSIGCIRFTRCGTPQ